MAAERLTRIYVLRDPRNGAVRYVGKTMQRVTTRLNEHLKLAKRGGGTPACFWVRELQAEQTIPILDVVEEVHEQVWAEREKHWIAFYRNAGAALTNRTIGGQGAPGATRNQEQRRRAAALTSSQWNEERRHLQSARAKAWAATYWTEERRASVSGRAPSEATKARIAAKLRERASDPEVGAQLVRQSQMGVAAAKAYWTPERRAANGEVSRRLWTPERRAAVSEKARAQRLREVQAGVGGRRARRSSTPLDD